MKALRRISISAISKEFWQRILIEIEVGNRVTSNTSSFYVIDPANRVTEDENHVFEYDVNGNQIRKTVKATGETWRYSYTIFDELSTAARYDTPAPDATATLIRDYRYDALGRRLISDDRNARNDTHYLYDGQHIIMSFRKVSLSDSVDVRFFTHSDITDDVLAVTGQSPASNPFFSNGFAPSDASSYYHSDHQGSVRALTDDTGAIINEYSYGAYGDTETEVEALQQPFRYTSREYDPDTGLIHYRARTYDPQSGRFLQEDPIGFAAGDLNVYRYVWNNPTNWTDPSGMSAGGEMIGIYSVASVTLLNGNIATWEDLSTGYNTARFLEREGNNNLSNIAGGVACTFFTLADIITKAGTGTITGVNDDCGVDMDKNEAIESGDHELLASSLGGLCTLRLFFPRPNVGQNFCIYDCPSGRTRALDIKGLSKNFCPRFIADID